MAELAPASESGEYRLGFAGDTFNTAWYLAKLQTEMAVAFFTAVGDDLLSTQMCEFTASSGIDSSHIQTRPNTTVGLYLISLDNGERSFSYWRGQSAARELAKDTVALESAMHAADIVYFSGITLAILDATSRENLFGALRSARDAGKTIAFDPNLRPRLWSDMQEMTDVIMHGAAVCNIALPSFEDEAQWFGDADPQATAERYSRAGAGTVIVKNGADQVYYQHGEENGTILVPSVSQVVDTTAAGDSFNAGIFAGLARKDSMPDTIARACYIAGQVVQGRGALVAVDPL